MNRFRACLTALLACVTLSFAQTPIVKPDLGGLGILEGDEGHDHVDFGLLGQVLTVGDDVAQQCFVDLKIVVALLKGDAEHILAP